MDKKEYDELCTRWDQFIAQKLEYYKKLENLAKRNRLGTGDLSDEEYDKFRDNLDKEYHQTDDDMLSGSWLFWGPTTKITELEDLMNPDFKLPGRCGKSFLDLEIYPEIIEQFGEVIDTADHGRVKILGFMYDASDDYIYVQVVETGKTMGVFGVYQ